MNAAMHTCAAGNNTKMISRFYKTHKQNDKYIYIHMHTYIQIHMYMQTYSYVYIYAPT